MFETIYTEHKYLIVGNKVIDLIDIRFIDEVEYYPQDEGSSGFTVKYRGDDSIFLKWKNTEPDTVRSYRKQIIDNLFDTEN